MTEKRFTSKVVDWWHDVDKVRVVFDKGEWIDADGCAILLNALHEENEQLKNQNELLSDELEQCKAVIDYRWSEYLKKKGEQEND